MSDDTIISCGLDALTILTPFCPRLQGARVRQADGGQLPISAVGRYLKNLQREEVNALHDSGISLWLIFEHGAQDVLGGADAGKANGQEALRFCEALGVPPEVAIYPAADMDVSAAAAYTAEEYWAGFDSILWPQASAPKLHPIGSYANGTLETLLLRDGVDFCWLAGASGWDGFDEFEASGQATLIQGPTLSAGQWRQLDWPDLGFSYDPDLILAKDFGSWSPP